MKDEIQRYLSKYIEISEELEQALSENLLIREIPRGTVLLREGELCNECFFILKGLIRSYHLKEAQELTTEFFMEEQVVCPSCYGSNTPSGLFLECLEDTIAFVGTPQMESEMYARYPVLESMSRIIGEKIMNGYRNDLESFRTSSPEQRYLKLVENRPGLIQRVPQYLIAAYLGITPESLSRIRKRISKNNS